MAAVTHLFVKRTPLTRVCPAESLHANTTGIEGNASCVGLRQVLILNSGSLSKFGLNPGDLRENVVVDDDDLHDFPSGTVVALGQVDVRLTFHCEPCAKIRNVVDLKAIVHFRGYLGSILNTGCVQPGDEFRNHGQQFAPIPYRIVDRVKWFLDQRKEPVSAIELVDQIGLSKGHCRAVPRYLNQLGAEYAKLVFYADGRSAAA